VRLLAPVARTMNLMSPLSISQKFGTGSVIHRLEELIVSDRVAREIAT